MARSQHLQSTIRSKFRKFAINNSQMSWNLWFQ